MREQEAAPSRRRRKSPPKEKAKARKFDIKEIFGELRTAFKIFNIVAALVTLYVIASLYTPWTGDAGAATAGWLLSNIGGAVIIPLLFLLYTEVKLILASPMNGWLRHLCGMFFIFIFLSMTLGLNRLTGGERELALPFLAAGKFGYGMSSAIYKSTGILGTVLAGLLTIYLTLMAFNIHLLSFIKLPSISLPSFSLPKFGRRAKEGGEPDEYEKRRTSSTTRYTTANRMKTTRRTSPSSTATRIISITTKRGRSAINTTRRPSCGADARRVQPPKRRRTRRE